MRKNAARRTLLETLEAFELASDIAPFLLRSLTSSHESAEATELGGRAGGGMGGGASDSDEALIFAVRSARASSLSSAPPTDDAAMSPHFVSAFREEPVELFELVVSESL